MAKKLLTSPKGVAVYPHLTKPDTKFKESGVYHIRVKYEQGHEGADALAAKIDEQMQESLVRVRKLVAEAKGEAKAKAINLADKPYSRDEDDGSITFSFKMNAKGKNKEGEEFTRKPVIFNANGVVTEGMKVGGGSIVKVSYEIVQFPSSAANATKKVGAGVTLRLHAVQVIKLVEYGANAEYFGFGDESDSDDAAPAVTAKDEDEETPPAKPAKGATKKNENEEDDEDF